jgi:hypothetical protein
MDSLIVAEFPDFFSEFQGKRFTLLWRGSRDGFGSDDFHIRCDGRAPTLTLIVDNAGNICGGFTPVAWESGVRNGEFGEDNNCTKADPSLTGFIFSLKNPRGIPATKFRLKAEAQNSAIDCNSGSGPTFYHIFLCFNGRSSAYCYAGLYGDTDTYANDAVVVEGDFFSDSDPFEVHEIEVFEITD